MKAIVYTRFSPRRKADESESCEVQEAYCEQYCITKGHEITHVFHDPDVSGSDEYREKLWQAINALSKGSVLVVYKRDRLARNVFLSEQIIRAVEKKGGSIEAVSGDVTGNTPEALMIRQVLASIAEYERRIIGIRTSHAMRFHQSNGRRMGSACPYGWKPDPEDKARMIVATEEVEIIAELKHLQCLGDGMGYSALTRYLNKNKPECSRTGTWNAKTVRKILLREERGVKV